MKTTPIDILLSARQVADHALGEGVLSQRFAPRPVCNHIGAVLADAVLQAGLNYKSVVRPRVQRIMRRHPDIRTVSALRELVQNGYSEDFLNWQHPVKVLRFERLVMFLSDACIESVEDLRTEITKSVFSADLQKLNGVGPKTVDYLACLIGVDSIAVDRHVRTFAKRVGVVIDDYYFLRQVFCYAADLIELSRRDFDAWVWHKESSAVTPQFVLAF